MSQCRFNQGFSLVELTISIAIVAVLVAAVSTTISIARKADYNSMVDDINAIAEAVASFQSQYGGLPGDLYNATAQFGSTVKNGDGDGAIEASVTVDSENVDERVSFWNHLAQAGLISGTFNDGLISTISYAPGSDGGAMEAPFKNSGYYIQTTTETNTVVVVLGKYDSGYAGAFAPEDDLNSVVTPSEAEAYDNTYDDGCADADCNGIYPASGSVYATEGADTVGTVDACADEENTGVYTTTNSEENCIIRVVIVD